MVVPEALVVEAKAFETVKVSELVPKEHEIPESRFYSKNYANNTYRYHSTSWRG